MKILTSRISGILLILAALLGLLLGISGLIGLWQIRPAFISSAQKNLALLESTLQTTSNGLLLTEQSLDNAQNSLQAIQSTLQTTAKTMQSTEPLISSIAGLAAQDLPAATRTAQDSLNTAAESAQVIDAVLNALSFLPGINYNPKLPLATSLKDLSSNLENLPETFRVMETNLQDTSQNLQIIQVDLALMIDSISEIETSLDQSENVITDYQISVSEMQKQLDSLSAYLPKFINISSYILTVFLIWLIIAQLGLMILGWQLITNHASPTRKIPPPSSSKKVATVDRQAM